MRVLQVLKNATALEKARAFNILGCPEFRGQSVSDRYLSKVIEKIEDYKLNKYSDAITSELKNFRGYKDWERKITPVVKQYEAELINNYIIRKMDERGSLNDVKSKELVEWAEILGAYLVGRGLKTSQIRKFLDSVRKLELNVKRTPPEEFESKEIIFLKVHLAYAKARKDEVKPLMLVMNSAINCVREEGEDGFKDFVQLVKFVEGVVAYHKFYGGSD